MIVLSNPEIVTDLDAHATNMSLLAEGYTVRHIETWHRDFDHTSIVWDAPEIAEADLPY